MRSVYVIEYRRNSCKITKPKRWAERERLTTGDWGTSIILHMDPTATPGSPIHSPTITQQQKIKRKAKTYGHFSFVPTPLLPASQIKRVAFSTLMKSTSCLDMLLGYAFYKSDSRKWGHQYGFHCRWCWFDDFIVNFVNQLKKSTWFRR